MLLDPLRKWLGYQGGLCNQVRVAADELTATAKELREIVAVHKDAPHPFASLLNTMWKNHEHADVTKKVSSWR